MTSGTARGTGHHGEADRERRCRRTPSPRARPFAARARRRAPRRPAPRPPIESSVAAAARASRPGTTTADDGRHEARPGARACAPARGCSPSVLSARNTAPWVTNSGSVVRPPSSPYGLSSVNRLPVNSLSASIGTPGDDVREGDAPQQRRHERADGDRASQRGRQAASSRLPRYSKATPRTISATRIRNRAGRSRRTAWRTTPGTRRTWRRRRRAPRPRCRPRPGRWC